MASIEPESPRLIAIHQSFLKPLLILGVERDLFIATATISAMLVFSVNNAYLAIIGAGFWLGTLPALQRLAKADPQMSRVYVRHARYAQYSPAAAGYHAPTRSRSDWGQIH
jgi:type IV secretory pathway TrbD component